jgi:hypothetical protein
VSDFAKLLLSVLVIWLAFQCLGWILKRFGWIGIIVFAVVLSALSLA